MGDTALVHTMPPCDFHEGCIAGYDFKTDDGRWANGCENAYLTRRMFRELGTGKGQKLEVVPR